MARCFAVRKFGMAIAAMIPMTGMTMKTATSATTAMMAPLPQPLFGAAAIGVPADAGTGVPH